MHTGKSVLVLNYRIIYAIYVHSEQKNTHFKSIIPVPGEPERPDHL